MKKDNNINNDFKLNINDEFLTDKHVIANEFNRYFHEIKANVIIEQKECANFIFHQFKGMNLDINNKFCFTGTTIDEILKLVKELDSNSSPGVSGIPTKLLKFCIPVLAPLFVKFFNDCISVEKIPDGWKCAIVLPLYKN